jgi:hypothetical protein
MFATLAFFLIAHCLSLNRDLSNDIRCIYAPRNWGTKLLKPI